MGMQPLNFCMKILPFNGPEKRMLGGGQVNSAHPKAHILPSVRFKGPLPGGRRTVAEKPRTECHES